MCKGRIPAYLGSSFAFIAPVTMVLKQHPENGYSMALGAFIITGLVFCFVALIIKFAGTGWINVVFPPAVMGAIVALMVWSLYPWPPDGRSDHPDILQISNWAVPQARPIVFIHGHTSSHCHCHRRSIRSPKIVHF